MKESEALKVYEEQAEKDIKEIRINYEANKDKVTDMLMERIMEVKIELPKVIIGNFEENLG